MPQPDSPPEKPRAPAWTVWLIGFAVCGAFSGQALAQNTPPAPPTVILPPAPPATPKTGVIPPPAHVDPGIKAKPPVPPAQLPTPVIPPPGTPGGDQSVQPR